MKSLNKDTIEIYNRYKGNKPINESHYFDDLFDDESWKNRPSCGMSNDIGYGPESFSDSVRSMPLSELLNQLKGTDEGLYRKLVYYIRDTYHEGAPNNSHEGPVSIEDIEDDVSSCGMGSSPVMTKKIVVMRNESTENKEIDTDLLVETCKALKSL